MNNFIKNKSKVLLSPENLISMLLMLPLINGNISEILSVLGIPSFSDIIYIFIYSISVYTYILLFIKKSYVVAIFFNIILILFLYSFLLNPLIFRFFFNFKINEIRTVASSNAFILFGLCLPIFLLFVLHIDVSRLMKLLKIYSIINTTIFILLYIIVNFIYKERFNYMSIAYNSLISIFFCIYYGIKEKDKILILLSSLASIFIIFGGSRGAMLTLIVYLIIQFFIVSRKFKKKDLITIYLLLLIILFVVFNFNSILTSVNNILIELGYTSRILKSIYLNGGIFKYDDRALIQINLIKSINLFGYGFYGDRFLANGSYAHNLFLEIIINFGLIFGSIIIICFILYLFKAIFLVRKANDSDLTFMLITVLTIIFVKYMVSGTYLRSQEVYFLLGIIFMINSKKYLRR